MRHKGWRILWHAFAVVFLTVLTQVGGIVYLVCLWLYQTISVRVHGYTTLLRATLFPVVYLFTTLVVVPLLAPLSGRVPLPALEQSGVRPVNLFTCLLNRHYVTADLRSTVFQVAKQIQNEYPGTTVNYMDACFPFFDGFPLFPHLTHNDGRKLDISFFYYYKGEPSVGNPSPIGYGASEPPRGKEINMPRQCAESGHWQYDLMSRFMPLRDGFKLDETRTRKLIAYFANDPGITKIFLEPHLRERLSLSIAKIRFHGCQAVRHDDHFHVVIKR